VIKTITQENLVERAATIGKTLQDKLSAAMANLDGVSEIRGKGLMIGIQLEKPCKQLMAEALHQGLLISVQSEHVIRLLPPLTINEEQIDTLTDTLSSIVISFLQQEAA
jgi:acetylornithine aminotransferase